jgi:CO/xanthine dehydrogenase FAD-binding subunit
MAYPATYLRPSSLADALRLAADPEYLILAGGTVLQPLMNTGHLSPKAVLDVSTIPELRGISAGERGIRIGSATTLAEIADHQQIRHLAPVLTEAVETIGCHEVRQQATVGGNIEMAFASMDTLPALLVMDAEVELATAKGPRRLPLAQHLKAGRTSRDPGELLLAVEFVPPSGGPGRFVKLGARKSFAPSVLSVAVVLSTAEDGSVRELRVAAGCCDDRALRLVEVEAAAVGATLASHAIDDLAGMAGAEIHPSDDIYASALYRRRALEELLRRTLRELLLIA